MTWKRACALLTKYYNGIAPHSIGKMTLYQFDYYLKEIDWLEGLFNPAPEDTTLVRKRPGEMMSSKELEALALSIKPDLEIP